jgi:hypothetical protein
MTPPLVVDSSTAIKWFSIEPQSEMAARLVDARHRLAAPELILVEVANALRRKERSGVLSAEAVAMAVAGLPRLFDMLLPAREIIGAAVALSQELDHSVYDCAYVAVAERLSAVLITSDEKLVRKLSSFKSELSVVRLADWKG